MSIKSIRTGWTGISALAGNDQWFSDFESIASITVTTPTESTITFSSIPSTYTHLQLRAIARTDRASQIVDVVRFRFNGDTASNYSVHFLQGDGATPESAASTSQTYIQTYIVAASSAGTGTFGAFVTDILDYTSTNKNKTIRQLAGTDNNGGGNVALTSGLWFKTPEAINSISLTAIGNFVTNSHFALYGIRG
jgi:hypothetical protein